MNTNWPDITIIVPNFNGQRLLRENLPHMMAAAESYRGGCRIIVVDDASTEKGIDTFIARYPGIQLVQHSENHGFAETISTGVKASESEILIFLNSDVRPRSDFLAPLIIHLSDPSVFAVSPLILNEDGTPNKYSWNRRVFKRGKLQRVSWDLDSAWIQRERSRLRSLFASGGSMAVRRSMFLELGGFASLYKPFYVEDRDIGVQAWRRGWIVLFEPLSEVTHQTRGSIKDNVDSVKVKTIQRRNSFLFEWSHFSIRRIFFYRGPYYLKQIFGRLLRCDRSYLMGLFTAVGNLKKVIHHRKHLSRLAEHTNFEYVLNRVNLRENESDE